MKKIFIFLTLVGISALQAQSQSYTIYVKVTSSVPEYENVIERTPIQECWNEQVPVTRYQDSYRQTPHRQDDTAAAVIGGVAGGILGHQIGKGRGKDVATISGAILGTLAGQNMAVNNQPHRQNYQQAYTTYETKRRCTTHYRENHVRNFSGYKNVGYFRGKKIVKYSDHRLSRIPVTVTISY